MVRSNIWLKATILTAILAGLAVRAIRADPPATTAPTTAPSSQDQSLATLVDTKAEPEARDNAARKLVIGHDASLKQELINILKNNADRNGQLAVVRAFAGDTKPDPDLIEPLFSLLQTGHEATHIPTALALAQYKTDAMLSRLIDIANGSNQPADLRVAVIQAIGTFDQKQAAQAMIGLQSGQDEAVKLAAGDSLTDMTGLEYGHDAQKWKNWWDQHASQPDADFTAEILGLRGKAFERVMVKHRQLESTVAKLLTDLYTLAPADQKDGIVIEYLSSPSEEIRVLGANIISTSRSATFSGPSPHAMQEVRLLLTDSSARVRAAAANALLNDPASADAMVAQLDQETDDSVRIQLINSLARLKDKRALAQMLKLVGPETALDVRMAAANGISMQGDLVANGGADLKDRAYNALLQAFKSTGDGIGPADVQALRETIIKAMAAINDPRFLQDFQQITSSQVESSTARINGLAGLGNLKDPNTGDQISNYLNDNDAGIRRAAVQALGTVPQFIYSNKLLDRMLNDRDQSVKDQAWDVLKAWMPQIDEADLSTLAEELKQHDAGKQLIALKVLRDRLIKGVQAMNGVPKQKKEEELAYLEQTIGDVLMQLKQPAPPDPANAAEAAAQYHAALDYWKANNGKANVIDALCADVVRAHLAAKQWDEAAKFAAATIAEYNDPTMKFIQEDVSKEFQLTAEGLGDSAASDAGNEADALFTAIAKMAPPLPDSYQQQLGEIKQQIQNKKAQGGGP